MIFLGKNETSYVTCRDSKTALTVSLGGDTYGAADVAQVAVEADLDGVRVFVGRATVHPGGEPAARLIAIACVPGAQAYLVTVERLTTAGGRKLGVHLATGKPVALPSGPFWCRDEPRESPAPWRTTVAISPGGLFATPFRGLYVGTGGDVVLTGIDGTDTLFPNVQNGSILPAEFVAIAVAGTTASGFVAGH